MKHSPDSGLSYRKKGSVIRPVFLKLSKENKKFPEKNLKKKGCLHTTVVVSVKLSEKIQKYTLLSDIFT